MLRDFATASGGWRCSARCYVVRRPRPATSTCSWSSRRVGRQVCSASQSWSWSSARCWGGRSSCGPMRTSAGTSGTKSGHGRGCSMQPDDEVRVRHLVEAAGEAVEVSLAAALLQRQPLLRGPVQDLQVPARIPRALRLHSGRPIVLPGVLRLVQRQAPTLRDRAAHPTDVHYGRAGALRAARVDRFRARRGVWPPTATVIVRPELDSGLLVPSATVEPCTPSWFVPAPRGEVIAVKKIKIRKLDRVETTRKTEKK